MTRFTRWKTSGCQTKPTTSEEELCCCRAPCCRMGIESSSSVPTLMTRYEPLFPFGSAPCLLRKPSKPPSPLYETQSMVLRGRAGFVAYDTLLPFCNQLQ